MKTTLFIPVLNEIEAAQHIMPKIRREWVDEILVVDGHSTDGTAEWFRQQGYKVIEQRGQGLAGAYWTCFEEAEGDIIVAFTPDGNSLPELIPALVAKVKEGYDVVIASRYKDGAKSEDDDIVTAFGNWMFTKIVNILFGGYYTDVLVMYRAFRKDLVQRLSLTRARHSYLEQELVIRPLKHGLKVAEIPGDEPKRIGGVRKMRVVHNGSIVLWAIIRELFIHRVPRSA